MMDSVELLRNLVFWTNMTLMGGIPLLMLYYSIRMKWEGERLATWSFMATVVTGVFAAVALILVRWGSAETWNFLFGSSMLEMVCFIGWSFNIFFNHGYVPGMRRRRTVVPPEAPPTKPDLRLLT